ncbi:MAG: hypothetical protein IJK62_04060 [Bacteroidales bacterium]|nr:hypothetical protein [Bacteroidales bacterium]
MKDTLSKHIDRIFKALKIETSYELYAYNDNSIPSYLREQSLTHEYIVCCSDCSAKERLQQFIGKEVHLCENHIYWFEGDLIANKTEADEPKKELAKLKTSTRLPAWIDNLIFKNLNAIYSPDYECFGSNLHLSEHELLQYLGSYFPRSYAETFCIFDNLFHNKYLFDNLNAKNSISILSIGCGTGGDIIGLLTSLLKYFHNVQTIKVFAIDGNKTALEILKTILEKYKSVIQKQIYFELEHQTAASILSFDIQSDQSFDFILSSKMIGELVSFGKGNLDNSYYDFAHKFLPCLTNDGLCLVLDVTTRSEHTTFNPILMNRQLNNFLKENNEYSTLLPLSCHYFEKNCNVDCFFNKTFYVTHSQHSSDKTKVAYRILGRNEFVKKICSDTCDRRLLVQDEKYCPYSEQYETEADAFILTNLNSSTLNQTIPIETITETKEVEQVLPSLEISSDTSETDDYNEEGDEYYKGCVVIDTNAFVECPDIISKISDDYYIVLSARVLEELDGLKVKKNFPTIKKKRVAKALKFINESFDKRDIVMEDSDWKLLPVDFKRENSDSLILSVALKHIEEDPLLLTSDNGMQVKAKGLGIRTISLKNYLKQLNS